MFDNVYQEYIDSIYMTNFNQNRTKTTNFENTMNSDYLFPNTVNNEYLEKFYPDIYRLLNPMIKHVCMKNVNQLSEKTINGMVEEVYSNFISDPNSVDDFNSGHEFRSGKNSETSFTGKAKNSILSTSRRNEAIEKRQTKEENYILRDLIRILIVRELIRIPEATRSVWKESQFRTPLRNQGFSF